MPEERKVYATMAESQCNAISTQIARPRRLDLCECVTVCAKQHRNATARWNRGRAAGITRIQQFSTIIRSKGNSPRGFPRAASGLQFWRLDTLTRLICRQHKENTYERRKNSRANRLLDAWSN